MVRFIDMRDQIQKGSQEFCFWDTARDKFIELDGEYTFENVKQFTECYNSNIKINKDEFPIDRFLVLISDKFRYMDVIDE